MRILILSTVHRWNDPRIFHKQACTLAKQHEVVLAAVDDGRERIQDNVEIRPLGVWKTRWDRPRLWLRALGEIRRSRAEVVHFHDPELALLLLPCALFGRKKFICDVHEHPRAAIRGRTWLPAIVRSTAANFFSRLLRWSPFFYDAVLLAEESYAPLFPARANVHIIRNFALIPTPDFPFFDRYRSFDPAREFRLLYIGSLTEDRGLMQMIEMLEIVKQVFPDVRLDLAGKIRPPDLEKRIAELSKQPRARITLHGYLDLRELSQLLKLAHIGLIPLQPHPNFEASLSTKFFDYMVFGLPCLASDFPLWRRFFRENPAGLTADVTQPERIAEAVIRLAKSPDQLRSFSENGYRLAREKFNWDQEGEALLRIYSAL
jgi:glycosyltransferase involved in cell wall biosynthesis